MTTEEIAILVRYLNAGVYLYHMISIMQEGKFDDHKTKKALEKLRTGTS